MQAVGPVASAAAGRGMAGPAGRAARLEADKGMADMTGAGSPDTGTAGTGRAAPVSGPDTRDSGMAPPEPPAAGIADMAEAAHWPALAGPADIPAARSAAAASSAAADRSVRHVPADLCKSCLHHRSGCSCVLFPAAPRACEATVRCRHRRVAIIAVAADRFMGIKRVLRPSTLRNRSVPADAAGINAPDRPDCQDNPNHPDNLDSPDNPASCVGQTS